METYQKVGMGKPPKGGIIPTTFDPTFNGGDYFDYTNVNRTIEKIDVNTWKTALSIYSAESLEGHWYWEVTVGPTASNHVYGVCPLFVPQASREEVIHVSPFDGLGWVASNGVIYKNSAVQAVCSTWGTGDILGFRMDHGDFYVRKNGVWQNGGDPVTEGYDYLMHIACSERFHDDPDGDGCTLNTGQAAFADTAPAGAVFFG